MPFSQETPLTWFEPGLLFTQAQTTPPKFFSSSSSSPPNSGSDGLDLDRVVLEERRVRRKLSNRESARRSRAKKQMRLDELVNEADRLGNENRVLKHHLSDISHRCCLFLLDNERLQFEAGSLHRRLGDLNTVLTLRRLRKLAAPPPPIAFGSEVNMMDMTSSCGIVMANELQTLIT